jgi:activator of HSP90 ATPase
MKESCELRVFLNATPTEIYQAWLSTEGHSAMTGGEANCSDQVGSHFEAWDGYIEGKNLELIENKKIVQSWRTSEFEDNDEDSILNISLNEVKNGTELILIHTNIPEGQTQYKQGWLDHYFEPMKSYFS